MSDGVPYSALSYAWGSNEKLYSIIVDDSVLEVTSNLFEALQHIRSDLEDRILWIDAICIDQGNEIEKGHQVKQMGRIYKEADQVLVWLGVGKRLSGHLMELMKRVEEDSITIQGDWRVSAQTRLILETESTQRKIREDLELLLRQPWFHRIWILQEAANARVATVRSVVPTELLLIPKLTKNTLQLVDQKKILDSL